MNEQRLLSVFGEQLDVLSNRVRLLSMRVEALSRRVEALEPPQALPKQSPTLVDLLAGIIEKWRIDDPNGFAQHRSRHLICEMAAWLRENDSRLNMGGDAAEVAELLEREASRR